MGIKVEVLDPTPDCPAAVVARQRLGSFRDPVKIRCVHMLVPSLRGMALFAFRKHEKRPFEFGDFGRLLQGACTGCGCADSGDRAH